MRTEFSLYSGLAGDLQVTLKARNESGLVVSTLIPSTGWLRYRALRKAKRKLLKELELKTGQKHIEHYQTYEMD